MANIGAQLYTVRKLLTTDYKIESTFAEIKRIGYQSVQLYGSIELIEKYAKFAKAIDLEVVGVLADLDTCENNESKLFEICNQYGISDIGISSRFSEFHNMDTYIAGVNAFAKKAKKSGFSFSYHNHGHEFIRLIDGKTAMDRFLKELDAETVDFMPDTYWLHDGGYDVRYFLEQTKGRVKILHLKDMKRTEEGHTFAELGNGNLYFEGIINTALNSGITNFIVEQDICEGDAIESLKQSYQFIKSLLEV